jgi:hypothetical protein
MEIFWGGCYYLCTWMVTLLTWENSLNSTEKCIVPYMILKVFCLCYLTQKYSFCSLFWHSGTFVVKFNIKRYFHPIPSSKDLPNRWHTSSRNNIGSLLTGYGGPDPNLLLKIELHLFFTEKLSSICGLGEGIGSGTACEQPPGNRVEKNF